LIERILGAKHGIFIGDGGKGMILKIIRRNDSLQGRNIAILLLITISICLLIPSGSAQDIQIIDIYSDMDSADVTIHSDEHYSDITINADLIFGGEVVSSRLFTINKITPDTDITKVTFWDVTNPENGFYRTKMTLIMDGSVLETKYYNFSYGWPALPSLFIKDMIPDSSGISIILTPPITQYGTSPALTDMEYMLVDGDTVIYRTTDHRISVVQATPLSKQWNVLLKNNHQYSTRIKARISSPKDAVIARSEVFTAKDDACITELYKDETGASATVLGKSQVPFKGSTVFTVSKDSNTIEEINQSTPILISGDDETIEVTWSSRLPPGEYDLTVTVIGNDADILDRWDTIIEGKKNDSNNDQGTPVPTKSPGLSVFWALLSFIVIYLLFGRSGCLNR
jgi:hypothetical protein